MTAARQQLAEWLAAAAVGAALLLLSNLLVPPPDVVPAGHPARFVAMVASPLFTGEIPHRVLWPLLAHVAGWFGVGPIAFSQACCAALIAVVFWFCRRRGAAWLDAGLIAAAVAASGAVLVQKPLPCMSDPLNLLLLVLTVHFVARPAVFWGLVLLAAFSHEMVFFLAPWLLWLRCREGGGSFVRDGGALVLVLAIYGAFRLGLRGAYDASYYVENNFWAPWLLPALWVLLLVVTLAEFGPLLVIVVAAGRRGELGMGGTLGHLAYAGGVLAMTWFAYDVMRFATFAFLPVVLGSLAFLRQPANRVWLLAILLASIGTYAWQHPIASQQGGRTFTELAGPWAAACGPHVVKGESVKFADALAVQGDLLRQFWPTVLVTFALAAAVVVSGRWLAARLASAPLRSEHDA